MFSLLLLAQQAQAYTGYLRLPDVHGDTVVFCAEGDLWTVPVAGGTARRLTSAAGDEIYPRYSPDGRWIAYSASYDGNLDVYVIPAAGGEPRRLTWSPAADLVVGFSPDGTKLRFRSYRSDPNGVLRLFEVPVGGGEVTELPLGWASWLDEDTSTGQWAFTRTTRENATWKRYRGGTAADIWVGDPKKKDFKQVTSFAGADAFPMWSGGRVWFLSDEGGAANLWSMKPDGTDRKRATNHTDWDARFPAMGPDGRVVYMLAGDLRIFDTKSGQDSAISIDLPGERVKSRVQVRYGADNLTAWDVSPDADRVLLTVRGDLWSLPVKPGPALPLTSTPGVRESWGSFSHDGKRVIYVTDQTGEEGIQSADAWGRGDVKTVLAPGESGWHFPASPSPDGSRVAWADQTQTLWVAPVGGGAPVKVDHSDQAEILRYSWSPDGRWLAYDKTERTDYTGVWIWDSKDGSTHRLSSPYTSDSSPAWDPDGRYLYFLSNRNTNPLMGVRDMTFVDAAVTAPWAVLLRPDVEDPFAALAGLPPKADAKAAKDKKKAKKKDEEAEDEAPKPVEIDFAGIENRVVPVPVEPGNMWGLEVTSERIYFARAPLVGMAEDGAGGSDLFSWSLPDREEELVTGGVTSFMTRAKAGKLAIMKEGSAIYVVDAGGAVDDGALGEAAVDTRGIHMEVDPRLEWAQEFHEAWRLQRDFFWEPKLGGINWKAERDRYAALLPRLATRADLNDLIGEVIGELATSHTYVGGGDSGAGAEAVPTGMVGADVVRDGDGFRVTHIFHGDAADNAPNPLLAPSAQVAEGDVILRVNQRPFAKDLPFEAAFVGSADRPVVLTVKGKAGTRDVVVTPLSDDHHLRYVDWVRKNREYVAQKTGGKVGYVHIPDMGAGGLIAFDTWFYPQLDKEALVVDVRWNRGGFVSQMIVERLRRTVLQYFFSRNGGRWTWPDRTLNGPFVVITNEFAGSDGDIFPSAVQNAGLAPVIGERSWGGVIGIRGDKPLVDGGFVSQPEYATWFPTKGWAVENHGVDPDIVVQNLPQDLAAGVDAQLDRAIAEVEALRKSKPPVPSTPGAPPTKTRKDFDGK